MYTYRIEQALRAAAVLHKEQKRRGTGSLPYITHLMAVTIILRDYTEDEDTLIAALLHDTLEDTDYTEDELREDFGDKVLEIIKSLTEPQESGITWQERKATYSKQLKTAPEEALMVAAADKIHNMRSMVEEYYDNHARFRKDFPGPLDDRAIAYQDISNVLNSRLKNPIITELNHVYSEYKNFIRHVKENEN